MSSVASLITTHPTWTLLPASFAFSFLSLSLTPSFISLIFLLTTLLLYTRRTLERNRTSLKAGLLWLTLTVSISLSHLAPSIHALSTPATSILSLMLLSGLSSAIALVPIYISHQYESRVYAQGILFPSLWATTWLVVSWISPIGRLITWSPLSGVSSYRWIAPILGFAGLDWIAAAWASVGAEFLERKLFVPLLEDNTSTTKSRTPTKYLPLLLAIPSFFVSTLPLPPVSPNTTPLGVACILPAQAPDQSQLERFVQETRRNANLAKVLLWPEGAVIFETESEKEKAFEAIQEITRPSKVWVGVSFEERVSGTGTSIRDGQRRNGMTLVGPEGVEMTYYKRKLVPIAESFSQIGSNDAPPIHSIDIPRPAGTRKGDWGADTRAIPLSASICLDFSAPLTSLDSRPALVLAPAKTWHTGVGRVMYELARARGDEIGAEVLWCDGGAGGLSGVAGNTQVGTGSWVKVIGVPYPFPEGRSRTVYGAGGDWLALAAVMGLPALILAAQHNGKQIEKKSEVATAWIRDRVRRLGAPRRPAVAEERLLIDA